MKIRLIAAVAACTVAGGVAQAATSISYVGYGTALSAGETLVTDFSNPNVLPPGFTLAGTAAFLTGTSSVGAAPATSAATRDPGQYLSVEAGQYETLAAPQIDDLSLYIGSVDGYNTLTFSLKDGSTQVYTGTQLASLVPTNPDGDQQSKQTNGRYTFKFDTPVTQIRFDSSSNSFEIADVAAVVPSGVPEPATWAMMLVGFGLLGAVLRATIVQDRRLAQVSRL
jgi:hypothetical protein